MCAVQCELIQWNWKDGAENSFYCLLYLFLYVYTTLFICYTEMHHLESFPHTLAHISIGFCWQYCHSDFMVHIAFVQPNDRRKTCMNSILAASTQIAHPFRQHSFIPFYRAYQTLYKCICPFLYLCQYTVLSSFNFLFSEFMLLMNQIIKMSLHANTHPHTWTHST